MLTLPTFILAVLTANAAAATIPVEVGKSGLTFEPSVIRANQGDVIEFRFWARNHSVVAGDFAKACQPASQNGFYSGFFPTQPNVVNSQVFRVTVSNTNPVAVYCSAGQHCQNGMVAVINPAGSGNQTLDAYAALVRDARDNVSPSGGAFGGEVASASSSSSSGSGTQSQTPTGGAATTAATTTGNGGSATTTSATSSPTRSGNAAVGVTVPIAGLVAAAVGAVFV